MPCVSASSVTPLRRATRASRLPRACCSPCCRRMPRCSQATRSTPSPMAYRGSCSAWCPSCVIAVFWIVHVMPEKIAHKRHHPQTRGDPDAVPAVAGLRRPAVADRLAVGLHASRSRYQLAYGTDKHEDYYLEMARRRPARGELCDDGTRALARRTRRDAGTRCAAAEAQRAARATLEALPLGTGAKAAEGKARDGSPAPRHLLRSSSG